MTDSLYMVPPLTAIFWHVLITTTCRPVSLFELLDCQPSICSFLRVSARRKKTVNSKFTKGKRKQKDVGSEMCNFHSARLMGEERRRQGGERREGRERRAGRGWIFVSEKETELRRLLCMQHLCLIIDFSYMHFIQILPFLSLFYTLRHCSSLNWYKVKLIN